MIKRELYRAYPAVLRNRPILILIGLAAIAVSGFGAVWYPVLQVVPIGLSVLFVLLVLIWWLEARSEQLIITADRVIKQEGLLARHISEIAHVDVCNIRINQQFLERLCNVGRIRVASAATGKIEIDIAGVPYPDKIRLLLQKQHRKYRQRRK